MRNFHTFLPVLALLLLMSCKDDTRRQVPEILHTVSTDAAMVYYAEKLEDALEMAFDSTDVVRNFSWGNLERRQAAVSFVFNRELSPVLSIDAGPASGDTLGAVPGIMHQASNAGFQTCYYPGAYIGRGCNLLVITKSEAVFSDVRRHLESGRSIMDLEDFAKAFGMAEGRSAQIVRNSAFDQIFPKKYLSSCFKRSELIRFACNFSDWIIITPSEDGKKNVCTSQRDDASQYANVLPRLNCAESLLPHIMPDDTHLALSLPIGYGYRGIYENWRYACSNLDKYKRRLADIKKNTATDPVKWEKQAGVREVSIIQWGKDCKALAIRADRLPDVEGCCINESGGFAAALYGSAFSLVDDSWCTRRGSWLICGSERDIKSFPDTTACGRDIPGWPQKPCRFVISHGARIASADDKGIIINE